MIGDYISKNSTLVARLVKINGILRSVWAFNAYCVKDSLTDFTVFLMLLVNWTFKLHCISLGLFEHVCRQNARFSSVLDQQLTPAHVRWCNYLVSCIRAHAPMSAAYSRWTKPHTCFLYLLNMPLHYTKCYSSISIPWNPERKWSQEGQKGAWNHQSVHIETDAACDRNGIYQLSKCHRFYFVGMVQFNTFPCWTFHQHPFVVFSESWKIDVVLSVETQIKKTVVKCPRR